MRLEICRCWDLRSKRRWKGTTLQHKHSRNPITRAGRCHWHCGSICAAVRGALSPGHLQKAVDVRAETESRILVHRAHVYSAPIKNIAILMFRIIRPIYSKKPPPCCVTIRAEGAKLWGILRVFSKNPPLFCYIFQQGGGFLAINRSDHSSVFLG